jgi:RNA polymerase sigma-70 factor (ECF subfamily)
MPASLIRFQGYLRLLASLQIGPQLRGKVDASSVVQETLLEATRDFATFAGQTEAELVGWLRQILYRNIIDAARKRHDVSLESILQHSSTQIEKLLVAADSSPSDQALRHEKLARLAEALAELPEEQREAVELKHLHGWRVAAIAGHMKKSAGSVAGLLRRGLKKLRELLDDLR